MNELLPFDVVPSVAIFMSSQNSTAVLNYVMNLLTELFFKNMLVFNSKEILYA